MNLSRSSVEERPIEPELRRAQRVRVSLRWKEAGEHPPESGVYRGWARIDGSWLHFLDDEDDDSRWLTHPIQNVAWIEWATP